MFGLLVMEVMYLSGHPSIINKMRNLKEKVKKNILLPKIVLTFHFLNKLFSDLKNFANSRPSASNFKSFSQSLEQFFLTVGPNNFGNKIPFQTLLGSNFL